MGVSTAASIAPVRLRGSALAASDDETLLTLCQVTKLLNRTLFESLLIRRALTDIPPADGERFVSAIVICSRTMVFSPGDRPPAG